MGFLYGVLGAVKNENEVTTYDKSLHSDRLDSVINFLSNNIGNGFAKFEEALAAVSWWSNRYHKQLDEITENVKDRFKEIKGKHFTVGMGFERALDDLLSIPEKDPVELAKVSTKMETCFTEAKKLEKVFKLADEAYSHLDPELKKKLRDPVRKVELQVEKFVAAATNDELKAIVDTSNWKVENLKVLINERVTNDVNKMAGEINFKFEEQIWMPIEKVKKELESKVQELKQWKEAAGSVVKEAQGKCTEIGDMVTTDGSAGGEKIYTLANDMKEKAEAIRVAAGHIKKDIGRLVLDALVAVQSMNSKLKEDLGNIKNMIKKGILRYVKEDILTAIKSQVESIKGRDGLGGIKEKVQLWAKTFGETGGSGFENTVKEWINEVLKTDGVVSHRLGDYITRNRTHGHFNAGKYTTADKIREPIRDEIMSVLGETILPAAAEVFKNETDDQSEIKDHVNAVTGGIHLFFTELDGKLKGDKQAVTSFVQRIVGGIESRLAVDGSKISPAVHNSHNLVAAVEATLAALLSTARQVYEELQSFTSDDAGYNLGENVQSALKGAIDLEADIKKALGEVGTAAGSGATFGRKSVEVSVADTVNEELPYERNALSNKVDIKPNKFKHYNKYVNQEGIKDKPQIATLHDAERAGDLTKAIKSIETTGLKSLTDEGEPKKAIEGDVLYFKSPFDKITAKLQEIAGLVDSDKKESGAVTPKVGVKNYLDDVTSMLGREELNLTSDTGKKHPSVKGLQNIIDTIQNDIIGNGRDSNPETLTGIINKAKEFYTNVIQAECNKAIREINKYVTSQLNAAAEDIQKQGKNHYYKKLRNIFVDVKSNVGKQIDNITKVISDDLATGVKGLLKTIYGTKGGQLEEIRSNDTVTQLSTALSKCFNTILSYVFYRVGNGQPDGPHEKVDDVKKKCDNLLEHLKSVKVTKIYNFDYDFSNLLASLNSSISTLSSASSALDPQALPDAGRPVLRALQQGMMGFVKELGKGYVNGYDGGDKDIDFANIDEPTGVHVLTPKSNYEIRRLTRHGERLAKIFLTIFNILHDDLNKLNSKCYGPWSNKTICEMDGVDENPLGQFMKRCGYRVPQDKDSKEGELKLPMNDFKGEHIHKKLTAMTKNADVNSHLQACESNGRDDDGDIIKKYTADIFDIMNCLLSHVDEYNEVCHLSTLTSKRQPCSVYEMLVWLSGLTHTPVKQDLFVNGLRLPFEDKNDDTEADENFISFEENKPLSHQAYPHDFTYDETREALTEICSKAYDTVVCIAGTGDAQTVYGCDYSNNAFNFYYPQDGEGCLDMLLDVLRRLFPPLRFLRNQCKYRSNHLGWRDCQYGMDVPTGKSQCTEHSRDQVTDQPKCQPTCQANSKVSCQPNSPLMSYLNDCLPGHLPHHLTKIGCKYECVNCPSTSKKGMPCMTPLGFRGFSGSTKTGKEICAILDEFFSIRKVETLFTLLPKPPSSLPEHFGFALSLVGGWYDNDNLNKNAVQTAFEDSIKNVSIQLVDKPNELTDAITNAYGSGYTSHNSCQHNHVKNLTTGDICSDKNNVDCAPYMSSLCADSYRYVAKAHSDTYLSWAVYLPWNFWTLLHNLYQDFCDIMCQDWGCRNCLNSRQCKRGQHGLTDEQTKKSHCKCESMVRCKGVSPTFYRYGFIFGNTIALNAGTNKKQCSDFCTLLQNVLKSEYFETLFKRCDKFLFKIRAPFIWLNVALWLLSLLYLIHIMVIRLDLLHIKSHLHSPSSHRIAAQSLLAAGRVNKLNRVFYLQP